MYINLWFSRDSQEFLLLDEIETSPRKTPKLPELTNGEVRDKVEKIGNGNARHSCLPVEVKFLL